jgi:hypothetical protein
VGPLGHARAGVFALALWLGLAPACAHSPVGVALHVDSNLPDATVWVDDVLVGTASDWARKDGGRHLRPGFHRVEVRAPGFYSVYQEIDQPSGAAATVKATLHPLLE